MQDFEKAALSDPLYVLGKVLISLHGLTEEDRVVVILRAKALLEVMGHLFPES
jgi:hypothetical protein